MLQFHVRICLLDHIPSLDPGDVMLILVSIEKVWPISNHVLTSSVWIGREIMSLTTLAPINIVDSRAIVLQVVVELESILVKVV